MGAALIHGQTDSLTVGHDEAIKRVSRLCERAWKGQSRICNKDGHLDLVCSVLYRVSQEECAILREGVPYVKLYRYNPKHLYPKLNGYGDNSQISLKLWQLLHTYWLPNTYGNWQEYVVYVILISVLNIKITCKWHKAIRLNYKNTRNTVVFVLRLPSTSRRPQLTLILWP